MKKLLLAFAACGLLAAQEKVGSAAGAPGHEAAEKVDQWISRH
jgi:hypothetical protein